MSANAAASFTDALRQAHLLEPAQLDELTRTLATRPAEPRALAGDLLRRGWLTAYQANQLLQGRGPSLLLGSYVLVEKLGEGGMGQVFKARNWKLGRIVAIKLIRKERLVGGDAVRRFHREIRAAAALDHPNVIRAYDADEADGAHFLVMEYAEGKDLAQLVKEQGPLPPPRACDCARQAALGLQHAYERGLVHRDIKPQNLLLTPSGAVKVLDLGLARLGHDGADGDLTSLVTQEGAIMGTPDYMAPEQTLNAHGVDIRADLYSLGCTLYFLLSGRPPFAGGSLGEKIAKHQSCDPEAVERLRPEVPPALAAVVRRLLAKRPEDRFPTPAEAAAALSDFLAGQTPVATVVPLRPAPGMSRNGATEETSPGWSVLGTEAGRTGRRLGRGPRLWLAVLGVAALVGLADLLLSVLSPRQPPAPVATPETPQKPQPRDAAAVAFERWVAEAARLTVERQSQAVAAKLKERNPGFDGKVTPTVEGGAVVGLQFLADGVTDLTPLRALPRLKSLTCNGSAPDKCKLADLSPLKGMSLNNLVCHSTKVADLSPLKGMPLAELGCSNTAVADLSPLKGMPLTTLDCSGTAVADLSPLKGRPLITLHFHNTKVADLSPLKGMPLTWLHCGGSKVADLSPLKGMPLTYLNCYNTRVANLSPLRGMRLTFLGCNHTAVADLSPLKGMPLKELWIDFRPQRDTEILRAFTTLQTINGAPVAQFWKEAAKAPPPKP